MKRKEYCVDTSYYDKNNKTYISNEDNEYFVDLNSAKEYFNKLNVGLRELKTLWVFDIDDNDDFDNFEVILEQEGVN